MYMYMLKYRFDRTTVQKCVLYCVYRYSTWFVLIDGRVFFLVFFIYFSLHQLLTSFNLWTCKERERKYKVKEKRRR